MFALSQALLLILILILILILPTMRGQLQSFEDMSVWQMAMKLAEDIFNLTVSLPRSEDYGLTSQIRRAGLSVSANIAEGYGREHLKDKINFYYNSRGSLFEVLSHLIYGEKVHYFTRDSVAKLRLQIEDILYELNSLIKSLRNKVESL